MPKVPAPAVAALGVSRGAAGDRSAGREPSSVIRDRADLLSGVPLFEGLSRRHLRRLAKLATETPVFSVVLTPHHFHEHDVHHGFFHAHFRVKGAEAARACVGTLKSLAQLAGAA